jgi:hypothetical protein
MSNLSVSIETTEQILIKFLLESTLIIVMQI